MDSSQMVAHGMKRSVYHTHSMISRFTAGILIALIASVGLWVVSCKSSDSVNQSPASQLPVQTLSNSTTLFVLGDWGIQGLFHQQQVADQMDTFAAGLSPSCLIMAGDNFYEKGVSSINDFLWRISFENVYTGTHLPATFYVALGNHDYEQSTQAQLAYGQTHPRWVLPARYYTQRLTLPNQGAIRLVVLDTNPFVMEYRQNPSAYPDIAQDTNAQLRWADSVLAHATEPWKIVVGHHPLYSVGADHGGQPEVVQQIGPLLQKYGVQLYIAGHSHTLQHLPRVGPTDFIVSGGGGAPLGKLADSTAARFAKVSGGFSIVSVNQDSLRVSFVDQNGKALYQFQRAKN